MGFQGDLADLPLQDILYVLTSHGKSGTLTLQTPTHEIEFVFRRATISSVATSDGSLRIGHLLVSQGYVTQNQIDHALGLQAVSVDSSRIGDLLVEVGYVTREQVKQAISAQLEASLFRILVHKGGTFRFEPNESELTNPISTAIQLEGMVHNAMQLADEWRRIHDPDKELILADDLIDSARLAAFDESERQIVMAILNGDTTIDLLALKSGLKAADFGPALSRLKELDVVRAVPIGHVHQMEARDTPVEDARMT